jgi:hypothetical protein
MLEEREGEFVEVICPVTPLGPESKGLTGKEVAMRTAGAEG